MKRRTSLAVLAAILYVAQAAGTMAGQSGEQVAIQQAEIWLSTVDGGRYGDSWDMAAAFFRNAVPKEQWINSMNAFRKPLGQVIERRISGSQYSTSLPGAPDGQYVVVRFTAVFENKKEATETVTPMLDADGVWRVSGYFIK